MWYTIILKLRGSGKKIERNPMGRRDLMIGLKTSARLFLVGWSVFFVAGGCASGPSPISAVFSEVSEKISRPQAGLLLDTIRLLVLIEDYASAFRARDESAFINCFSPRFSYYENTIAWFREQVREEYFQRFDFLDLEVERIEIVIYRNTPSFWLKQEDYDWLAGSGGTRILSADYAVNLTDSEGTVSVLLERNRERARPRPAEGKPAWAAPVPVEVAAGFDPLIEAPMAEVHLRVRLTCRTVATAIETREEQILLLESYGGDWRIVSLR